LRMSLFENIRNNMYGPSQLSLSGLIIIATLGKNIVVTNIEREYGGKASIVNPQNVTNAKDPMHVHVAQQRHVLIVRMNKTHTLSVFFIRVEPHPQSQ
jgi:hypothetical protein